MYTDTGHSGSSNRDGWKYTYKGSELQPYAQKLIDYYAKVENEQRSLMAQYMNDRSVGVNSKKVDSCKRLIGEAGLQREKCVVYAHEFGRNPDRDYLLTVGDVVFFGIAGERATLESDED